MKKITKSGVKIIFFAFILALVILAVLLCVVHFGSSPADDTGDHRGDTSGESFVQDTPGYFRITNTFKKFQVGERYIYFPGETFGLFKYDRESGEISEICTDPLCKHGGAGASCYMANVRSAFPLFRVYGDNVVYSAVLNNSDGKGESNLTVHLLCYNPKKMTNYVIEDNVIGSNRVSLSNRYLYRDNITVEGNKSYYNYSQIDLVTGEKTEFGNKTLAKQEYVILGASDGRVFATNADETETYICKEDSPGEYTDFWNRRISFIFTNGEDLFFQSKDHTDLKSNTYYYYHTDLDGNVIARYKLDDGISWGGVFDGKSLYYIPREEIEVEFPDGSKYEIHSRELYKIDFETGEQTVAFRFDGDWSYFRLVSTNNHIAVYDNKIYTGDVRGTVYSKDANGELIQEGYSFSNGLSIIDMETGDLTYITADYSASMDGRRFVTETKVIPMDLANEK